MKKKLVHKMCGNCVRSGLHWLIRSSVMKERYSGKDELIMRGCDVIYGGVFFTFNHETSSSSRVWNVMSFTVSKNWSECEFERPFTCKLQRRVVMNV